MAADQPGMTQGQAIAALRRHRMLIILVTLLGTAAGAAYGVFTSSTYMTSAAVLVTPLEGNPYSPQGRGDDLLNLETEAQLVKTDPVAQMARTRMKSNDYPGELRSRVSVGVPPNTQVLNISFTAAAPARARDGAQAFAESYLEYRKQRTQSVLDGKLKKLEDSSRRVELNLQNATRKMQATTGSAREYWNTRIQAYTNQLGVIEEQSNDVRSTPINPGQVITPAALPGGPSAKRPAALGGAGLLAGLALAVGFVLVRQRTERRLFSAEEVEQLGVPVLSALQPAGPGEGWLPLVNMPKGSAGDAYRKLRAAVVATAPKAPVTLLVTSVTPNRSATVVTSNLSVALAFAGSTTIMVDAATCEVDPAPLFRLRQAKGLSDTLLRGVDPAELLVHVDSQLRLLPRGGEAAEASHRFSGPRMRETIKVLRRRAGFLAINADSVTDADAQALCVMADAVLLIVTPGVTTRDELEQAYAEAQRAGTMVIGTVLDAPPPKRNKLKGRKEEPVQPPRGAPVGEPPLQDAPKPERSRGRSAKAGEPAAAERPVAWSDPTPTTPEKQVPELPAGRDQVSTGKRARPPRAALPSGHADASLRGGLPASDEERVAGGAKSEPGA